MTRLLLHLGETWPAPPHGPAAHWVLLDDAGKVLQQGHSEPAHWPAAARNEVVLGGTQAVWLRARLPRGARREEDRLLAYALEDRLVGDPDAQHLTVSARARDGDAQLVDVLVVARARLRALIAQLQALGRAPARVVAEAEIAPASAEHWTLTLAPDGSGWLKTAPRDPAACLPLDGDTAAVILSRALASARAANRPPTQLRPCLAPGAPDPATLYLGDDVPLAPRADYAWWREASQGANLLHGEFSAAGGRQGPWRALLGPLRVAAAALVLLALANLAQVAWQGHQLGQVEARMRRLFETSLPGVPAVDPPRQLTRQLDRLRAQHGELRESDFLALMLAYAEARGTGAPGSIRAARYAEGKLELDLAADGGSGASDELGAVVERLQARGLVARLATDNATPRLTLTRGAQP